MHIHITATSLNLPSPSPIILVATQDFLQGWNIALIVLGVLAFVIGDAIAAALGTWLAVRAVHITGKSYNIILHT